MPNIRLLVVLDELAALHTSVIHVIEDVRTWHDDGRMDDGPRADLHASFRAMLDQVERMETQVRTAAADPLW